MKVPRGFVLVKLGLALIVAGCVFMVATPGALAQSEQIVFSGVTTNGIGFWIWCQNENPADAPYTGACAGSMYDYDQGNARGVHGFVAEPSDGTYVMHVSSGDGFISDCTLTNTPPVTSGPHNTVTVDPCTINGTAESGSTSNAVVRATGPG
jgi:hypothetical protein